LFFSHRAQLEDQSMLQSIDYDTHKWVRRIGRLGIGARGAVFAVMGWLLILAAWHQRASEARGVGGALQYVENHAYGRVLLGCVAIGLVAFVVFQCMLARYRKIN